MQEKICPIIDFSSRTCYSEEEARRVATMALNMQEFGRRIVAARTLRGWSQQDLVRASGVGQNNLSDLEQGKKPGVRADTVVRLAEALGVGTDYLLGLTDAASISRRLRSRKAAPVG
jgi:DNA-binding Xre family transcriptional regulator